MSSYDFDNGDDFIDSIEVIKAISNLEDEIDDLESDIQDKQEEIDNFEYEDEDNPTKTEELELKDLENEIIQLQKDKSLLEEELEPLQDLEDEFEGYCDWKNGETLIRDTYINQYLKDLVEDIGDLPSELPSYIENNIDWEGVAEDLKANYTSGEFDGITYWVCSS